MNDTGRERRKLAARAQSLSERLSCDGEFAATVTEPVAEWRDQFDDDQFAQRLALSPADETDVAEQLSTCGYDGSPPEWTELIDELRRHLSEISSEGQTVADWPTPVTIDGAEFEHLDDETEQVPFEHVLAPVAAFAVGQLETTRESALITEAAVWTHAVDLLGRLGQILLHPLFVGFKTHLRADDTPDTEGDAASTDGYRRYVETTLADGCWSLFEEYPVAARWTATVIRQWVDSFDEFTERLEADADRVAESVFDTATLSPVTSVRGAGDFHHDGRRVFKIGFETGETVAYKPRALGPEAGFSAFLSWVNAESSLRPFRVPTCVDRGDYGWMEWIEPTPCASQAGVERYFRQAGATICLLYALRFCDGNVENVAAVGDQIVIHDLEAVAQPTLPERHQFAEPTYLRVIEGSVRQTGMVPMGHGDDDLSHLNGIDKPVGTQSGVSARQFTDTNTDAMELTYTDTAEFTAEGLPVFDDERHDPREYADEIVDGFRRAYDFLLANKTALLSPDGPLSAFEETDIRFLYRDSATYAKVRRPLWTSKYLRSGLSVGLRVDLLTRQLDLQTHADTQWAVFRAERSALWNLDIPRFTLTTTEQTVAFGEQQRSDVLEQTPLAAVRERIRALDATDRAEQVAYLRLAYDPDQLLNPKPDTETTVPETTGASPFVDDDPDWERIARAECEQILDRIETAAVRRSDGELVWYQRVNRNESAVVQSPRDDLYDGRLGIAVFASAMASTFGWERARRLAREAADPVVERLAGDDPQSVAKLGAGHGVGSLLYGFVRIAEWLDEPSYLDAARRCSDYVTRDRLQATETLDLIGGVAGVVPGLLLLYKATGDRRHLDRAVAAGEVLLDRRETIDGVSTWPPTAGGDRALIGPAHGVSGQSYALDRLATAVDRPEFATAAREALQFEAAHYRPDVENWPDFRFDACRPGWCAGRSGVGLTRLVMRGDDGVVDTGLDRALGGSTAESLVDEDDICCGNFSRVEFLLTAARELDRPALRTDAARIALGTVERARDRGGYSVAWQTDDWYATSLFLGEPGIGYSLCRLAGCDLPSLLLWE